MKIKYMIVEKYINGSPADFIIFHGKLTQTNFIKQNMGETNTSKVHF